MNVTLRSMLPKWSCITTLIILSLCSVCAQATDDTFVFDFSALDVTALDPDSVKVSTVDHKLVISVDCSKNKPRIVRVPLERETKNQKVQVTIAKTESLHFMGKYKTDASGQWMLDNYQHYRLEYEKGPIQFSLDNKYHKDLFFSFRCGARKPGQTNLLEYGVIYIDKIEIVPLEYSDDRDFAYILAVLLVMLFLIPGFLAYGALFKVGEKEKLLVLITPLSIFSFLIFYLVLTLSHQWSFVPASGSLLAAYIVLNMFFIVWLIAEKRLGILASNLNLIRFEMLAIVIVMLCVAAIITKGLDLPLNTFGTFQSRFLTYGAMNGADTLFQYANGIAIFHDEPFSKYYQDGRLVYEVQDRGVIGGILYAVMRGIVSPLNLNIAYSFGFYTLFGSALDALILLPLFALHKHLFAAKERPLLIFFLISASAFLVTNILHAYFKFAGAGLIISGLVFLLIEKNSIKAWIVAAVLWGLATNFHPGLALSLPVVTIWLLYRFWRTRENRFLPVFSAFFALVIVFVVMNMPWAIVKANHFQDTNKLFRVHFLAYQPYDAERGIIGSIREFADRFTLEEQISMRYERLRNSLHIEDVESLIDSASTEKWETVLTRWNFIETSYSLYVFAALIILIGMSSTLTRLFPTTAWNKSLTKHNSDFRGLLITQVLTIFLIIIATMGQYAPDDVLNLPMSCLLIVLYLLVHRNIAIGKIGLTLIVVYSLFTHFRLLFQYFQPH